MHTHTISPFDQPKPLQRLLSRQPRQHRASPHLTPSVSFTLVPTPTPTPTLRISQMIQASQPPEDQDQASGQPTRVQCAKANQRTKLTLNQWDGQQFDGGGWGGCRRWKEAHFPISSHRGAAYPGQTPFSEDLIWLHGGIQIKSTGCLTACLHHLCACRTCTL